MKSRDRVLVEEEPLNRHPWAGPQEDRSWPEVQYGLLCRTSPQGMRNAGFGILSEPGRGVAGRVATSV